MYWHMIWLADASVDASLLNFWSEQREQREQSEATLPQCSSAKCDITPFKVNGQKHWSFNARRRVEGPLGCISNYSGVDARLGNNLNALLKDLWLTGNFLSQDLQSSPQKSWDIFYSYSGCNLQVALDEKCLRTHLHCMWLQTNNHGL